jgi:hypothetical protein
MMASVRRAGAPLPVSGICLRSHFKSLQNLGSTWILHASEVFMCKALRGKAIVNYALPLITQQMDTSDAPAG